MVGIQDSNARWRTFLQEQYSREIQVLASAWPEEKVLLIEFSTIQSWDPLFAQNIIEYPKPILREGSEAIRGICREGGWDIEPVLRVTNLPHDCKISLRDVGSKNIEKFISSEVVVTKVSEIKPRIYHASFRCEVCNHTNDVIQLNELELIEPLSCDDFDGGCGRFPTGKDSTRFVLIQENSSLVDNQWIEVQELPEQVAPGAQPARASVLAEGDLTNSILPGMRIIANLVPFIRSQSRGIKKTPMFNIYHTLMSSENENTPFKEINITKEEEEEILEISQRPDLHELLTNSIAPSIFGTGKLKMVKRSLMLQLFGGVSRRYSDGTRARGDIHVLLMGDPGVAKSQLLTYMSEISPRGRYASGGGVSGAGLTAAAVKDAFNDGRFSLEAGLLVLADSGLAAIDEFDKMNNDDRSRMHEAMEQQRIHISKGGINASMRTRCAVLAAANPINGRFSTRRMQGFDHQPLWEEVNLPPALISRFDIVWLMRDEIQEEHDRSIAEHILANRSGGVSETLVEDGRELDPRHIDNEFSMKKGYAGEDIISIEMFQKYLAYSKRNIHPVLNDEAKEKISDFYMDSRKRTEGSEADETVPITARALEALVRLSEAHARSRLSQEATVEDTKVAIATFRNWRFEYMGDEWDEGAFTSGIPKKQRNAEKIVLDVIRNLSEGIRDRDVNDADIFNECARLKISEFEIENALSKMVTRGILMTRRAGVYSLT